MSAQIKSEEEMKRKMRRFESIWKLVSPEFPLLFKRIMFHIIPSDPKQDSEISDKKSYQKIVEDLFKDWKMAQTLLVESILERLSLIKALETQKNEHHRNKQGDKKKECINKIIIINNELRMLRRCVDALVWLIFDCEHSSIRRLPLKDGIDNISAKNINETMLAVNEMNKNPLSIALACDLTTFVHVGDVILRNSDGIEIIELKSGEKNIKISQAAAFSLETQCPVFEENYMHDMNATDKKHYFRAKKQQQRLSSVVNVIETGQGYDNYHDKNIIIDDRNYQPEFFHKYIIQSWNKLCSGKNWDIHHVDDCLYIGVYRDYFLGFAGFNAWMDGTGFKGKIFNINDSFIHVIERPLLCLGLPLALLEEIIDSKLTIVLCLDYKKFVQVGNSMFPGLFKYGALDTDLVELADLFNFDGNAVYSMSNGVKRYMGTGMESRIIFDFQYPRNVIEWCYKSSDLKKNLNKVKNDKRKALAKDKKKKRKIKRRLCR
ncbi:hypothetical protein [Ewingella americana]|uniref:hypothetical protein n=1 Tax=Ewingella americana TaxID=41202 RepID=UPI00163ACED7|nr:hypothetical protein [Ewingella americana]QMV54207.1 hypothetical protein GXP68_23330 [Ewingella americana]